MNQRPLSIYQKQLPQVKTFFKENYSNTQSLDKAVNEYVVKIFNETGNYPKIKVTSKLIGVIINKLIEVNRA